MTQLKTGISYGSAARAIYDQCCKDFSWDSSKSANFEKQQPLFALDATPEGYGVWFCAHSVRKNGDIDTLKDDRITNVIIDDTIVKVFQNIDDTHKPMHTRVVFVKTKNGYEFIGVYKKDAVSKDGLVIRYKRVSDVYPEVKQ